MLSILVFAPGFGEVSNVLSLRRDFSFCSVMNVFISALIDMEIWESHLLVIYDQYTTFTCSMVCCFLPKMREAEMMHNHRMTGLEKPLESKDFSHSHEETKRRQREWFVLPFNIYGELCLPHVAISESRHGKPKSVYFQVSKRMHTGWNYH